MARLLNVIKSREAGEELWEDISEDLVQERLEMLDDRNVPLWMPHQGLGLPMVFPDGAAGQIKGSDFWEAKKAGGRYETSKERDARWLREEVQKSPFKATGAAIAMGFGRGASFNATSVLASAGLAGDAELRDVLMSEHPYWSVLAELGGVGVTTAASMGMSAPASATQLSRTLATAAKFIPGAQAARLTTAVGVKVGTPIAKLFGKGVEVTHGAGRIKPLAFSMKTGAGLTGKMSTSINVGLPGTRDLVAQNVAEGIVGSVTAGAINASLDSAMYTTAREFGNLIEDKPGWSAEGALANIAHDAIWGGVFGAALPGALALGGGTLRTGGEAMRWGFEAATGNRISRAGGRTFAKIVARVHGMNPDQVIYAWSLTKSGFKDRKIRFDEALEVANDPEVRTRLAQLHRKLEDGLSAQKNAAATKKAKTRKIEEDIATREGRKQRIDEHWNEKEATVQSQLYDLDSEAIALQEGIGPLERAIEVRTTSKAALAAEKAGIAGEYRADLRNAEREMSELAEKVAKRLGLAGKPLPKYAWATGTDADTRLVGEWEIYDLSEEVQQLGEIANRADFDVAKAENALNALVKKQDASDVANRPSVYDDLEKAKAELKGLSGKAKKADTEADWSDISANIDSETSRRVEGSGWTDTAKWEKLDAAFLAEMKKPLAERRPISDFVDSKVVDDGGGAYQKLTPKDFGRGARTLKPDAGIATPAIVAAEKKVAQLEAKLKDFEKGVVTIEGPSMNVIRAQKQIAELQAIADAARAEVPMRPIATDDELLGMLNRGEIDEATLVVRKGKAKEGEFEVMEELGTTTEFSELYKRADFKKRTAKYAEEPENILNDPDGVANSIATRAKTHFENLVKELEEAYVEWGGAGKGTVMQAASRFPAMHIDEVRKLSTDVLTDLGRIVEDGSPNVNATIAAALRKKASEHISFAMGELQNATSHGQIHQILNNAKRYVGTEIYTPDPQYGDALKAAQGFFKSKAGKLRDYLENPEVWGDEVATLQKTVNLPMSETINHFGGFKSVFFDPKIKGVAHIRKLENYVKHFNTSKGNASTQQLLHTNLVKSARELGSALQLQKGTKLASIGKRLVKSAKALNGMAKEADHVAKVKDYNRQLLGDVLGGGPLSKRFVSELDQHPFFVNKHKLAGQQEALAGLKRSKKKMKLEGEEEVARVDSELKIVEQQLRKLTKSKADKAAAITLGKKKGNLEKRKIAAKRKALKGEQTVELVKLRAQKRKVTQEATDITDAAKAQVRKAEAGIKQMDLDRKYIEEKIAVGEGAQALGATKPGGIDVVSGMGGFLGFSLFGGSPFWGALIGSTMFAARKPAQFATQTAQIHRAVGTTYKIIDDKLSDAVESIAKGKIRAADKGMADPLSTFAGWLAGATMMD